MKDFMIKSKLTFNIVCWYFAFAVCLNLVSDLKAKHQIIQLAADGAWTWFNDERAIIDDENIIIGSLDSQGVARVDVYNTKSKNRLAYPLSSWQSKDDHDNPALLKLNNGQLLACYAKHNREKQWYWRIADKTKNWYCWLPEKIFVTPAKATYCNLIQLSGENNRIYNFSRIIGWNPNIQYSDNNAQSWYEPFVLIKSGDDKTRPYVKYADNGIDRIDLLYTDGHPLNMPINNVYHLYYKGGNFYTTNETKIKSMGQVKESPLLPSDGTLIYDGNTEGRGWVWDLEYDKQGNPIATFINSADHEIGNDLRYRYARWNPLKKQWDQQQIAFAGKRLYESQNHYAGGITIDPEDVNTVFISCNVDPRTGNPNKTGRYQVFQGKTLDANKTWDWKQLTFNTDVDNLRPFVPHNHKHKICVIWFQGRYDSFTDFKQRLWVFSKNKIIKYDNQGIRNGI